MQIIQIDEAHFKVNVDVNVIIFMIKKLKQ